jgi:AraC-like DNA-binding protein
MHAQGSADRWMHAQSSLAAVDPLGTTRLATAEQMTTRDPGEARLEVARMLSAHTLDVTGRPDRFHARVACARLEPLSLVEASYGSAVRLRRAPADSYAAILIPVQGRITVRARHSTMTAEPYRTMVVVGEGDDLDSDWEPGARAIILRIESDALDDAVDLIDHRRGPRLRVLTGPVSGASGFAIYGAVQLLAQTFARAGASGITTAWRRHLVQHTLLTALLAIPHTLEGELGRPDAIRSAVLRRAVDAIESESSADVTVPGLALLLGVTVRTLELGFRREFDCTPSEFLRAARLRRVHEELQLAERESTTVSSVASKWGFSHHGRFARNYRERYGMSPADTLRG